MTGTWVGFALLSALFTTLRHIHIKNKCSHHPPEALLFTTRLAGAILITPFALAEGLIFIRPAEFALFTALTVVITAIAILIQITLLQREDISRSIPYLSFIPVFMIPMAWIMLRELPGPGAFAGIVLASAGAYIINLGSGTGILAPFRGILSNKTIRFMLFVSICLAFNTVADKIAIGASSPLTYIFVWAWASSLVMLIFCLRRPGSQIIETLTDRHILLQSIFWIIAYSCQMFGIRAAFEIPSGVTYVKALTLLNILGTVILGGAMFRERHLFRKSIATALMVVGSILVILASNRTH